MCVLIVGLLRLRLPLSPLSLALPMSYFLSSLTYSQLSSSSSSSCTHFHSRSCCFLPRTGSRNTFIMASFTYAADFSSSAERSEVFSVIESAIFMARIIGQCQCRAEAIVRLVSRVQFYVVPYSAVLFRAVPNSAAQQNISAFVQIKSLDFPSSETPHTEY